MPRKPIDYSNTVFYKLVCRDITILDLYVGHTTDFKARKSRHKSDCYNSNNKGYVYKVYTFIRNNGGWENWDMVIIQRRSCVDEHEAHTIERGYIETLNGTLNCRIPARTLSEWTADHIEELQSYRSDYYQLNRVRILEKGKIYAGDNKQYIADYMKQYQEKNKDKIQEYRKLKYEANIVEIKEQRALHKEVINEKQRKYREENKNELNEKQRKYRAKKKLLKQEEPLVELTNFFV